MIVGLFTLLTGSALARDLDVTEKKLITDAVTKDFKDPSSAQFRWLPIMGITREVSSRTYCGMVNGKNSYGAYIGFAPFSVFLAIKDSRVVIAAPLGAGAPGSSMESVILKICIDGGGDPRQAR